MKEMGEIQLANPLPSALAHYEVALVETLGRVGVSVESYRLPSVEGLSPRLKISSALATLRIAFWPNLVRQRVVRLWPVFGLVDLLIWPRTRHEISACVIHDPVPLRRQFGFGRMARLLLGIWPSGLLSSAISHSRDATLEIRKLRQDLHVVEALHPIRSAQHQAAEKSHPPVILVAGQFKPARDLEVLERLGSLLRSHGFEPRIVGRGWPTVEGWFVDSRFLGETELEREISRASAVLVPYRYFFQSGIMLRALENGSVPVAPLNSFSEAVLGHGSPFCVSDSESPNAWLKAIRLAASRSHIEVTIFESYRERCDASWTDALRRLKDSQLRGFQS